MSLAVPTLSGRAFRNARPRPLAPPARLRPCTTRAATAYEAPSSMPAASELQALGSLSVLVPDTLLFESAISKPTAATVTCGVLLGIMTTEQLGTKPFKTAVTSAFSYDKCKALQSDQRVDCQIDKAMANVGALFAEQVEGRVCTEIDPRLAQDTGAMVSKAHHLLGLYEEMKVPANKLIFRLPASWEGIQAAGALEAEGVATQIFLVYSFVQGCAAAQAGASVVQPNVGRVRDWYRQHPGVIRDPKGPREDSGYASKTDPGLELVAQLYNYCKSHHPHTAIMASGLRTKADALALAGCDYLVLGPKVLSELSAAPTIAGYNDGLSAVALAESLERPLSPSSAQEAGLAVVAALTRGDFQDQLGLAGRELLEVGLARLRDDVLRFHAHVREMTFGTE